MADNKSMTIDGFRTLVSGYIFNNKKLDSFTTRDSHPLDSVIWKEFKQSIFSKDFSPLIANLRILNKIKKDDFYRLIEKYKTTKSCADLIQRIDEDADLSSTDTTALFEVLKNDTTFSYSEFPVLYSDLLRNYLLYQAGKKELKGIIDNIKTEGAEILKKETIVLSTTTSQEILGIESFIGFDLGATYIPKLSATPFFITLSPYLCKIDPDKDYNLFESSIWCFLTPTVGFSFGNGNEKIKPIYFAGVGVRLNKIVRVAIGGTYFTPLNSDTYKWSFGLNASINTNYISEFIKSITSVQSNIQK